MLRVWGYYIFIIMWGLCEVLVDELEESLDGFGLGDIFLDALLVLVE